MREERRRPSRSTPVILPIGKPFLEMLHGRYIVVRGRLWRKTNPNLPEDERKRLVSALMSAHRAVKEVAGDEGRLLKGRRRGESLSLRSWAGVVD